MLTMELTISFPVVEYLAGITFSKNAIAVSLECASLGIYKSVVCLTSIIDVNSANRRESGQV